MPLVGTDQFGKPYYISIDATDGSLQTTPAPGICPSTGDNSVQIKVLDLIASALRLINVLASGEPVPPSEANDSLMVLNQMIDAWNAQRQAIFTTSSADYAYVLNQQAYTLGPGGDFNTNRPARIDAMSTILINNPANPIEVPLTLYTVQDWQTQVPVKNVSGSIPLICYDDGGFPLRTLNFWPIPTQPLANVRIYSWQPIGIAASLTSFLHYPPGYAEAFRYNLAIRLAPEFGAAVPAQVALIATSSLAVVKSFNTPDMEMRSDLVQNPSEYNYKADLFGIGL